MIENKHARNAVDAINAALLLVRDATVREHDLMPHYRALVEVRNAIVREYYVDSPATDFDEAMRQTRERGGVIRGGGR